MDSVEVKVLEVDAKDGTRRFSVKTDDSCEFVTMTNIKDSPRKTVLCNSSFCKTHNVGTKRAVKHLDDKDLCPHLKILHTHLIESNDPCLEAVEEEDYDTLPNEKVYLTIYRHTQSNNLFIAKYMAQKYFNLINVSLSIKTRFQYLFFCIWRAANFAY